MTNVPPSPLIVPLPPFCPSSDQRDKAPATTKGRMVSPHLDSPARVNGFWWGSLPILLWAHMEPKREGERNKRKHIGWGHSNVPRVQGLSSNYNYINYIIIIGQRLPLVYTDAACTGSTCMYGEAIKTMLNHYLCPADVHRAWYKRTNEATGCSLRIGEGTACIISLKGASGFVDDQSPFVLHWTECSEVYLRTHCSRVWSTKENEVETCATKYHTKPRLKTWRKRKEKHLWNNNQINLQLLMYGIKTSMVSSWSRIESKLKFKSNVVDQFFGLPVVSECTVRPLKTLEAESLEQRGWLPAIWYQTEPTHGCGADTISKH